MTAVDDTIKEDKEIAVELGIDDRVYRTTPKQAFITLKDHKPNFNNNPKVRLLNPTKTEIGRISKQKLAKINSIVRGKSGLNQWTSTEQVIKWFINIDNKEGTVFIQYDVCDFYSSITEELINKSLDYASTFVEISESDRNIILQCKKSFLFE